MDFEIFTWYEGWVLFHPRRHLAPGPEAMYRELTTIIQLDASGES
jgi:hypothetical protein